MEVDKFGSQEYMSGLFAGAVVGAQHAATDIAERNDFRVPTELMIHNSASTWIIVAAIVGAVVFIMGSVLYVISSRTKDWIAMSLSSGGKAGVFITSISGGSDRCGIRPTVADSDCTDMVSEIGALIIEQRMKQHTGDVA